MKIEIYREHIHPDFDLSVIALHTAVKFYKEKFYTYPKGGFLKIKVSINDIFGVVNLIVGRTDEEIKREFGVSIYFECDKTFPDYYWEVVGEEDGRKFILYSEGA